MAAKSLRRRENRGRILIFEKLRAQAKTSNSKLQAPKKHQAPSSKTDLRAVCPASDFGVWGLRFGTSLELGVGVRCGLHLMQIMQSSFSPSPTLFIPGEVDGLS